MTFTRKKAIYELTNEYDTIGELLPEAAIVERMQQLETAWGVDKLRDEGWTQFIIILENEVCIYFDDMQGTVEVIHEDSVSSYTCKKKYA